MTRIRCRAWCQHRGVAGLCRRMHIENGVYGECMSILPVHTCGECVRFSEENCDLCDAVPVEPAKERCFDPREGGEADG